MRRSYSEMILKFREHRPLSGFADKVVEHVIVGRDSRGYDRLAVQFTDGTTLLVEEKGQVGYFYVNGEETMP